MVRRGLEMFVYIDMAAWRGGDCCIVQAEFIDIRDATECEQHFFTVRRDTVIKFTVHAANTVPSYADRSVLRRTDGDQRITRSTRQKVRVLTPPDAGDAM